VRSPALITGGAGFVGTNLADRLLRDGRRVRVLDDLSRPGVERNLRWLERTHGDRLEVEVADLRDEAAVGRVVRGTTEIFHFAAQVAVTTSLEEPLADARVNLNGTLALLEAARLHAPAAPLLFTSTNKVYGALTDVSLLEGERRHEPADQELRRNGISEQRPLAFCTPYGCSKGAADQYVLDYAHSYGLPTAVFRMSCIYGPHQLGNEDQGWVAHFLISALDGEPITIFGDGKQVRDVLFVDDLVDAFLLARDGIDRVAGRPFNIGGGPANAVSLMDVVGMIDELRGAPTEISWGDWRAGDQRYYVSDPSRFGRATGWAPTVAPREGLRRLHDWLERERDDATRLGRTGAAA
jgi:CDP-paratose 2-epimerase